MPSNRILPVLAGLVLLMVLFVGLKSCGQDSDQITRLEAVPKAGTPDADSPADTIRTLTAEVAAIRSESEKLRQQNEHLLRQRKDIETSIRNQLRAEAQQQQRQESSTMKTLNQQLEFFKTRLDELSQTQNQSATQSLNDIPVGFGLEDAKPQAIEEIHWVEPLGTETDTKGQPVYIPEGTKGLLDKSKQALGDAGEQLQQQIDDAPEETPVYTIPRNSTLIGSTGMTALIGRIPIDGVVEDPFPFKVIVGKDNLAANGITIPGLDGMIFTGKSSGDWTLSCVRGELHSVTYVFEDGTIRTLSSDSSRDQELQRELSGSGSGGKRRSLGWISDRRGIPCVTGKRVSNTYTYLAGRIMAKSAEAAAEALSQNQVTNTVSGALGVTTSVITGDAGKYALGKAAAGGADEIAQYILERAAQSFDAIFVDTGAELAVHIDVELPIDYELNGRKTSYAYFEDSDYDSLD